MTTLDYMKKQILKNTLSLEHLHPNTPPEHAENIKNKIGYYKKAVEALERQSENE